MKTKKTIIIFVSAILVFAIIFYYKSHYFPAKVISFSPKQYNENIRHTEEYSKQHKIYGTYLNHVAKDSPLTLQIESIKGYSQGGIVLGDYAYFTAQNLEWSAQQRLKVPKHRQYPYVCKIRLSDFKMVNTYHFKDTYDSSPLVIASSADTLILAHEHNQQRTSAYHVTNSTIAWESLENQPGNYFFGYSYYEGDGMKLIFVSSDNGLHAISSEDGHEVWSLPTESTGGVTPAVDQANTTVYYQSDKQIFKLNALSGNIEKSSKIKGLYSRCISWNTLLAEYDGQKYITTYWYNTANGKGGIRVFDTGLNLVWEKLELTASKKATLTYHHSGNIVIGCGNAWKPFSGNKWKKINAYHIKTGEIVWSCDLSRYKFTSILNVPAFNNFLYAETQDDRNIASSKIFKLHALTGEIEEIFYYGKPVSSCAPTIIAKGYIFSGNLYEDELNIIRIAENSKSNWIGPFGDPQKNQMSVLEEGVSYKKMSIVGDTIKSYSINPHPGQAGQPRR